MMPSRQPQEDTMIDALAFALVTIAMAAPLLISLVWGGVEQTDGARAQ
jgi:hypothetical protein